MRTTSAYTYGSRILYGAPASYGGSSPFGPRPAILNEFSRRITHQTIRPIFLATVPLGQWLQAAILDPTYNRYYFAPRLIAPGLNPSLTQPGPIHAFIASKVIHEQAGELPQHPSSNFLNWVTTGAPGSWYQTSPDKLWFNPPTDKTVAQGTYRAVYTLRFSNEPKTLDGIEYDPRILSIPRLSLRIDPAFGGVGQVGGGKLLLNNADAWFDRLGSLIWDEGDMSLEMGIDLPAGAGDMAREDYRLLGTWSVERAAKNADTLELILVEQKNQLDLEIPHEVFTREDYPTLDRDKLGDPIPRAYGRIFGAEPIPIDRSARRFKVAGHPIRSFDGVRILRALREVLEEDLSAEAWEHDTGSRYSTNENRTIKNVMFNGSDLTEKNSIGEVGTTPGSWHQENQLLYVRPPAGQAIDGGTWSVAYENTISAWVSANFSSTDIHAAEFTLGSDWDRSEEVSVDFTGRTKSDGSAMTNGADILADLLDYAGGIQLDNASFAAARAYFHLGFDAYGNEKNVLAPSLYLDEAKAARETVSELNAILGTFLFVDAAGKWRFEVFRPRQGEDIQPATYALPVVFDEQDILSLEREVDHATVLAAVRLRFAPRLVEDWDQSVEARNSATEFLHNLPARLIEEREVALSEKSDARYLAQRILSTEGQPRVQYRLELAWPAFFLVPGDQFRLNFAREGPSQILEALEVKHDLTRGKVQVVAGNRRAWEDTFGHWLADLADYSGSLPPGAACILDPVNVRGIPDQPVLLWEDSSGNGRHGQETIPDYAPTYQPDTLNGQPALKFNHALPQRLAFLKSFEELTQGELFAVVQADYDPPSVTGQGNYLWTLGNAGTTRYPDTAGDILEGFGTLNFKNAGNPGPSLTSPRLLNVIATPSEFTYNLDTAPLYTTPTNTVAWHSTPYLGTNPTRNLGFSGLLFFFLVYPRKLTTAERDQVLQFLSDRFNLGLVAASGPPPDWDPLGNAEAIAQARQNSGFWLDETNSNSAIADNDPRSARASRWW